MTPSEIKIGPPFDWNQSIEVPENHCVHWKIGPLSLEICRLQREWQIWHDRSADPLDAKHQGPVLSSSDERQPIRPPTRYPMGNTEVPIRLIPVCADRAIIAKPLDTVVLPAKQQVTVYIGSPVWVRVLAGETILCEIPTWIPASSWFGPSTIVGSLCYSTRTRARLDCTNLLKSPGRILTAVVISNASSGQISIERLALPLPLMATFATSDGSLWTEQARIDYRTETDFASAEMEKGPPLKNQPAIRVCPARQPPPAGHFSRLFGALLKISV